MQSESCCYIQGGVTEEQMLKFMGAYTQLSPLQAKKLLEVVFQDVYVYYLNNLKVVAIFCICPPKFLAFTSSLPPFCM